MRQLTSVFSKIFILVCLLFTLPCEASSFGQIAQELTYPAHYVAKLIHGICLAMGVGLNISGVIKYLEYRRHPHIRLSLIFFLFLTGLALVGVGVFPIPGAY